MNTITLKKLEQIKDTLVSANDDPDNVDANIACAAIEHFYNYASIYIQVKNKKEQEFDPEWKTPKNPKS